jgi:MFS family permease
MIFWLAGSMGQLFSGFLQAAAYTGLNGVHGRAGWRWLFIIDGIITIPLALAGYAFFPNLPQDDVRTWWTTQAEHELSMRRMEAIGRAGKEPWTLPKVKRILLSWHTYILRMYLTFCPTSVVDRAYKQFTAMLYVIWNNGVYQPGMGFWLKSFNKEPFPVPGTRFSVPEINYCRSHRNSSAV